MTYLIKDPAELGPRKWLIVDMPRFSQDLAKAIGFGIEVSEHGSITLISPNETDKLNIHLHNETWSPSKSTRVQISCSLPDIPHGDRAGVSHSPKYELPSITVSADRDMALIARDVCRRIIVESGEPAQHCREFAAERNAQRSGLNVAKERLKAAFGDNVRLNEKQEDYSTCPFTYYYRDEGPNSSTYGMFYLDGRLNADGSIYVDKISSIDIPMMQAIVASALAKVKTE